MRSLLLVALGIAAACAGKGQDSAPGDAGAAQLASVPAALLPGSAAPSLARLPASGEVDGSYLADVESCGACHPDVFAQQQASGHAFASFNNPIYRVAVETLRDDAGALASEMCAGCHDASLLVDGAMQTAVAATDPRAHNGVSCRLCHGIDAATRAGNGSYQVGAVPLPLPRSGDEESLRLHVQAARPLSSANLCASCHDSFLSKASGNRAKLVGQNDFTAWSVSAYSGNGAGLVDKVEPQSCVGCHMPRVAAGLGDVAADSEGRISSHAFLGGHTYLAAMAADPSALEQQRERLQGIVTIDAISRREEGDWLVDVVMRNVGVGHRFPGGVRDAANTWVEVELLDGEGRVVARSSPDDPHRLRSLVADQEGHLLSKRETHRFAAGIADHTIAPRQVALVRYRGQGVATARSVRARLLHQSRSAEVARLACAETRSARGAEYLAASASLERIALDGCADMPVTEMALVERDLREPVADFTRWYEHGLGLLGEVQERASEARPSLEAALRLATGKHERAMALGALGQLDARLGRVSESLATLSQAAVLAPTSAAIPAARGDALARVWRWREAADAYAAALAMVPGNLSLWRRFAMALGSSGQARESLSAAQEGLRLAPRDADLLRVQALALAELGAEDAEAGMAAYLEHRGPDDVSDIRLKCSQRSPQCARESLAVHEHRLEASAR